MANPQFHRYGAPWTPPEDRQLADLRRAGKSLAEIARQMGRPVDALRKRMQRLNLPRPGAGGALSEPEKEKLARQLAELFVKGLSISAIARVMGKSEWWVCTHSDDLGISRQTADRIVREMDEKAAQRKARSCLSCGVVFDSWGPGNRLCPACRIDPTRMHV
ncbi:MAG: hypothetical protein ACPGO3_00310 [Magnetospiraceae bacterium]